MSIYLQIFILILPITGLQKIFQKSASLDVIRADSLQMMVIAATSFWPGGRSRETRKEGEDENKRLLRVNS